VMYLGQIVELGPTDKVLARPQHPYTRLLLDSVPQAGRSLAEGQEDRKGELPSNRQLPQGCYFRERCPYAGNGCQMPQDLRVNLSGVAVRCHRVS
jgi:peptide/nickel transport system ATP-binding protein